MAKPQVGLCCALSRYFGTVEALHRGFGNRPARCVARERLVDDACPRGLTLR